MTLPVVSRPTRLPLTDLSFDDFERFCRDLIASSPEVVRCYRYGTQGDNQEGIDIVADSAVGKRWGVQCKRYKRFTRANVQKAVGEVEYRADRYFLLLACEATANARRTITEHEAWELWDVEDISLRVRQLPVDISRRLVETYFGPSWRRAFLGFDGLTPFVSPAEFFRPWMASSRLFNHAWELVGRNEAVEELMAFTHSQDSRILILPGRGGSGKSKLLQIFGQRLEGSDAQTELRFLVPGVPLTSESADELAVRPYVLVVDDAHRYDDLPVLLALARRREPAIKLVLTTRPGGIERLHSAATVAGFDPSEVVRLADLRDLNGEEVEQLARQALGPEHALLAETLADLASDSPLLIVVGGRLIAEGKVHPRLLQQHEDFRNVVLQTFRDVLLGQINERLSPNAALNLLRVIAAVAPVFPEHAHFREAALSLLGEESDKLSESLDVLEDSGVLLRRGYSLRITPDILADYILEEACLNRRGGATGFAKRVYEAFRGEERLNILKNLAELDWRTHHNREKTADLLAGIWTELESEFRAGSHSDQAAMLGALRDIAYYQPQRTMALIEYAMRNPSTAVEGEETEAFFRYTHADVLKQLPPLLQRIAHHLDYTARCCDLLWELGRDDWRETGPHPEHAIRVLKDLAEYDLHKPITFNEQILSAVERWLLRSNVHDHVHSALDVLDPLLDKVNSSDRVIGAQIMIRPFLISAERTRTIRDRALALISSLARSENLKTAVRALNSLQKAARNPRSLFGIEITDEDFMRWEPEQLKVFDIVGELCASEQDPLVYLAAIDAIGWHAEFGRSPILKRRALEIIESVPKTLDLFLTEALLARGVRALFLDPGGTRRSHRENWMRRQERLHETVLEFLTRYSEPADGFNTFVDRLEVIEKSGSDVTPSIFLELLGRTEPDYAALWCEAAVTQGDTPLSPYLGALLPHVRQLDERRCLELAHAILTSGNWKLCAALGTGFRRIDWSGGVSAEHEAIFRQLLIHPDEPVRRAAVDALAKLANVDPRMMIDLAMTLDIGSSSILAEELCELFDTEFGVGTGNLTESDWVAALQKLETADDIGGHHMGQFLTAASQQVPRLLLSFLFRRMDQQGESYFHYRPIPFEFESRLSGFSENPEYRELLRDIRNRAMREDQGSAYWLPQLYQTASNNYDEVGLSILQEWIDSGSPEKIDAASYLLKEASPNFVFQHLEFMSNLLEHAFVAGDDTYRSVKLNLLESSISGVRQGRPGHPMPQDVAMRNRSKAIAGRAELSYAVRQFYEFLAQYAEDSIREDLARDAEFIR